ncbi:hypothetical protein Tco_1303322 [Tanacetum coccineum]
MYHPWDASVLVVKKKAEHEDILWHCFIQYFTARGKIVCKFSKCKFWLRGCGTPGLVVPAERITLDLGKLGLSSIGHDDV